MLGEVAKDVVTWAHAAFLEKNDKRTWVTNTWSKNFLVVVLRYEWNIYGFTLLLMLGSLCRFCVRAVVHGIVLTLFLVVQKMRFLGTRIGVHVPQRKACSLPKKSNEAVVLSLPFPSFSALSCRFLQQQLFTSTVFVLLLSEQTRCAGRDVSGQGMQFLSPFPLLGRPDEPAAISPGISWLYLFSLESTLKLNCACQTGMY